jgi:hypothetical protein
LEQAEVTDERDRYGAPLDAEEAALIAALRARGLNELAQMALYCFGQSYGHAPTALAQLEALFVAVRQPRVPNQLTDEVKRLDPRFAAAMARVFELAPEFSTELDQRPVLLSRDERRMTQVVSHQALETWFLAHGVRCRLAIETDSPNGHHLVFLEAELVP